MTEGLATLAELLAPLTEGEFFNLLRRRESAFYASSNCDRYASVVGWDALRRMLEAGDYPKARRDDIRVTRESHVMPSARWTTDGKVDVAKLDELVARGYSVVVLHVDEHVPELRAICEEVKSRTSEGSFVGVVVTSRAANGAFSLHYDPEDLLIVQVEGTKRWQVFGPAVANPLRGMPKQPLPGAEPIFDEVLVPGDLLFVPAGNWHHCECGLRTSVHLGIFFLPPTGWHVVNEFSRSLLNDDLFRTPLTRLDGSSAIETVEAEVKDRIMQKVRDLKLSDFIDRWHKTAY